MKQILNLLILVLFTTVTHAQSLKQKTADKLYANMAYTDAYPFYKELASSKKATYEYIRKAACCAYNIMDYENAEKYYKKVLNQYPSQFNCDDAFGLFQTLKYNAKYDEAIAFLATIDSKKPNSNLSNSYKKNRNYINEIKKDSSLYTISNVNSVNTMSSEFSPYLDIKLNKLIFSSNRKNSMSENKVSAWDNTNFIDSYSATKKDSLNFESPNSINGDFKTKYHDGPIMVSADEKKMFITRTNTESIKGSTDNVKRLDLIIYSINQNGKWDEGVKFPFCNNLYSVGYPAITSDGKRLYFASDMPGGFGKSDLWYSDCINNEWQKPVNLGATINTEERETFPYIFENDVLFFASDGHAGLGGLDIYYCSPTMDLYFEPQALSYPINTRYDDFGMYLNDDFKSGYISSNRPNGKGKDDIYYFKSKKPILTITQKGIVYDNNTKLPINNARVFLLDKYYSKLDSVVTDSKGAYSFTLPQKLSKFKIGAKERNKFYDRIITIDTFKISKSSSDIYLFPKYRLLATVIDSVSNKPINGAKISIIYPSKTPEFELTDVYGNVYELLKNKKLKDTINIILKIEKDGYKTKAVPTYFLLDTTIIVKCVFKLSIKKEVSYTLEIVDESGNLVNSDIEVVNNKDNKTIHKFNTKENNKMPLQLKSGENYGISVAADGYLFQSENLNIPEDAEYSKVKRIVLKRLTKGSNIVLNNVFFDVAKSTLRPTSIGELDRLYNVLVSNSSMKIELSGHTDNQGNKLSNQKLSLARAKAVVDYLISKGIAVNRLVSKGYGFDKPVATNSTEEGRQLNRRTELKILEIN